MISRPPPVLVLQRAAPHVGRLEVEAGTDLDLSEVLSGLCLNVHKDAQMSRGVLWSHATEAMVWTDQGVRTVCLDPAAVDQPVKNPTLAGEALEITWKDPRRVDVGARAPDSEDDPDEVGREMAAQRQTRNMYAFGVGVWLASALALYLAPVPPPAPLDKEEVERIVTFVRGTHPPPPALPKPAPPSSKQDGKNRNAGKKNPDAPPDRKPEGERSGGTRRNRRPSPEDSFPSETYQGSILTVNTSLLGTGQHGPRSRSSGVATDAPAWSSGDQPSTPGSGSISVAQQQPPKVSFTVGGKAPSKELRALWNKVTSELRNRHSTCMKVQLTSLAYTLFTVNGSWTISPKDFKDEQQFGDVMEALKHGTSCEGGT